jgi:hypothetical protein
MFKFNLIILLSIALLAQPADSRVSSRSRSRSRSRSSGARSRSALRHRSFHMTGSRRGHHSGVYIIGDMQVRTDTNGTCTIGNKSVLSTDPHKTSFGRLPYCLNKMHENCRVCTNVLYYSKLSLSFRCCDGHVKDQMCYERHLRDVTGNLCDRKYFQLNDTGHCYLAYPILLNLDNLRIWFMVMTLFGALLAFAAVVIYTCIGMCFNR